MRSKIFLLLLFFTGMVIHAQENVIELSINEALELAKENNYEIKLVQTEVDKMGGDFNKSLGVFLPQITLSETFVKTNDPLNSFGFKLKQEIVTQADFNPALLNDPPEIENFTTKLEVTQPLINVDGFFGRAAAADGLSAMENKLKRTKEYVVFMIKQNYYQLILAEKSIAVIDKALEAVQKHYTTAKDFYDEGFINKSDLLMVEVMLNDVQRQKLDAVNNYKTANGNLKFLLGIEEEGIIKPTDNLSKVSVGEVGYSLGNVNKRRSDMLAMKYRISSMEKMSTMNKLKFLPRLNAFGSFEYNDSDLFGTNADSWMIGLNLQWNIFNGFGNIAEIQKANADLDNARLEYNKAADKNKVEIESAMRQLKTMEQTVELASKAKEQSKEGLKIIRDRYEQGLERTADLLTAEAKNSESALKYLGAVYGYNLTVFHLELLLEENLATN
ncbi:MAG: TolC family protein [Ignavibacteria bacterium]